MNGWRFCKAVGVRLPRLPFCRSRQSSEKYIKYKKDQFGIAGAKYEKVDEGHFTVTTEVELSDMFYAWIFGFGRRAKIIDPPYVADKMREYCQKIAEMYEPK